MTSYFMGHATQSDVHHTNSALEEILQGPVSISNTMSHLRSYKVSKLRVWLGALSYRIEI